MAIQIGAIVAVQTYFDRLRATAFGILMFLSYFGVVLGPYAAVYLNNRYNIEGVFLLLGGFQLQCVWIGLLFRPITTTREYKESLSDEASAVLSQSNDLEHEGSRGGSDTLSGVCLTLQPCSNSFYPLYFIAVYLLFCGHFYPFMFLPMRAKYLGYPESSAALFVTYMATVSGVVQLVAGFASDKIPKYRSYVCASGLIIAGLSTFISYFFPSYWSLILYAVTFGCAAG